MKTPDVFNPEHRYILTRKTKVPLRWIKKCLFIMLNPSTADEIQDDPTIRRCIGFAESMGCTDLTVVNLYAYKATSPKKLIEMLESDPLKAFGYLSNVTALTEQIEEHSQMSNVIICAWGKQKKIIGHANRVVRMIEKAGGTPLCLGTTKDGLYPRHPLYVRADKVPEIFNKVK